MAVEMEILPENSPPAVTSQWISAHAGSGKTYVLTRAVVRLLLLGVPAERICCITYTKVGAGEMRARILALLRRLMLADEADCRREVADIVGQVPDAAVLARARLLFGAVLESPSGGLQLTTIHGFCQKLLRAFPLEARVSAHFTVADEAQATQLAAEAKRRLLTGPLAMQGELAAAITLLASRSGEMGFDQLVREMLARRDAWENAWAGQDEESYRARLMALTGADETIDLNELAQGLMAMPEPERAVCLAYLTVLLAHKNKREQALGEAITRWCEGTLPLEEWLQLWLTQKFEPRKTILNAKDFPQGDALAALVERCVDKALRFVQQRAAVALCEESYAVALLARQLNDLYHQVKDERQVLDYPDLITRTRQLLTAPDMVGWVMSKLDHRIDHLLVDEAQDTSAEQWRIAHVLVDELVVTSGGVGSAGITRSLFVVGDEKQSIFSFQGAAPELYAAKKTELEQLLAPSPSPMQTRALEKSYRSAPAILQAADAVAALPDITPALSATGIAPTHIATRSTAAGCVVLHPPIQPVEKETAEPFTVPLQYQITRSTAQLLAETVSETIRRWLDAGAYNAGDILILTRSRQPMVLPLLRALQRLDIPVAGIDRLVLADHLAVKDLLALMGWCLSPHDDLLLAQVLRSPLMGWSEEQLYALAQPRGALTLWEALQQQDAAAAETIARWSSYQYLTPYDFLTRLLEAEGARKRFAGRFGEEIHEILDELKEQAANMPRPMAQTLAHFTQWIGASDRTIKREMESGDHDHVRVMTVHGSKGLEAPVVLMVDADGVPDLKRERFSMADGLPLLALSDEARMAACWVQARSQQAAAQLAEYYRLLYVAMTRPRDALHVFARAGANGSLKENCWYETIRRGVQNLPTHRRLEDGTLMLEDAGYAPKALPRAAADAVTVPEWATRPPRAEMATPTLSPSRLHAAEALAPFRQPRGEGARERGVRLHRVLQFLAADTTVPQLARLIAHIAPDWTDEERAAAQEEIWALFTREHWLWEHPSQAEVQLSGSLTLEGVTYPVFGQIDKLVDTGDSLVVVDYKTGRDVPESSAGISQTYLLQLKLYVSLLETLYPGKKVRPAIVWTANATISWLDDEVSSLLWSGVQPGISA